ncbi:hypothetical protein [Tichowtungia aerotolerans]|uniref:Uncharacterized protein n=1 Tax=Tichowtungia aerotolerans TaxID=2697043 RepID=A0A6P1MFY3_9BACT|nr:hypothetical protein [Tichowtungia aerotolerans]QHI69985.1 hypothetical protein GT409_11160 [Tichowtungia aerotolerans]
MKKNPAEQQSRDRMEPGALTIEGFLGTDDRPLADIIAADTAEVEAAGLTIEELGAFLEGLHKTADAGWEGRVPACNGKITVRSDETLGQISCPFTSCGDHCHKAVIGVKDAAGNDLLEFTPLDAHLIRKHGFFQGKGSPYRIGPKKLIAFYRFCKG